VYEELKRMWKEAIVAQFKLVSQNLPGGTGDRENYEKPQLG
jgi:hypothetical protein